MSLGSAELEESAESVSTSPTIVHHHTDDQYGETQLWDQLPQTLPIADLDEFFRLFRPCTPTISLTLWREMSVDTAERFLHCRSNQLRLNVLFDGCSCSFPQLVDTDHRQLLVELLLHVLNACVERGYSAAQLSCVYGMMVEVHRAATSSCGTCVQEVHVWFEQLLRLHCVHRPPVSLDLFSMNEAQWLTVKFCRIYLRHFALIMRAFTDDVRVNLQLSYQPYTLKISADSDD